MHHQSRRMSIPHILLVDDYPADNFLHRRLLLSAKLAQVVSVCENGRDALDWLQQCSTDNIPGLILLDLNMPVMDGWGFLHAHALLPLEQQVAQVLIMLSTSLPPAREAELGQHTQVKGCVAKPLSIDAIQELLT